VQGGRRVESARPSRLDLQRDCNQLESGSVRFCTADKGPPARVAVLLIETPFSREKTDKDKKTPCSAKDTRERTLAMRPLPAMAHARDGLLSPGGVLDRGDRLRALLPAPPSWRTGEACGWTNTATRFAGQIPTQAPAVTPTASPGASPTPAFAPALQTPSAAPPTSTPGPATARSTPAPATAPSTAAPASPATEGEGEAGTPRLEERKIRVDPDVAYESGLCSDCQPTKPGAWERGALYWTLLWFGFLLVAAMILMIVAIALCFKYLARHGSPARPRNRRAAAERL
jgi:hypothetical protein